MTPTGSRDPVVLLVDDDAAVRRSVAEGLELEGFEVVPASGGRDRIGAGGGRDVVAAGAGNDVVSVRGGGSDRVSCGPGGDVVSADGSDSIGGDCERVDR